MEALRSSCGERIKSGVCRPEGLPKTFLTLLLLLLLFLPLLLPPPLPGSIQNNNDRHEYSSQTGITGCFPAVGMPRGG